MSKIYNIISKANTVIINNPWKSIIVSIIISVYITNNIQDISFQFDDKISFAISAGAFASFFSFLLNYLKDRPNLDIAVVNDGSCFFPYDDSDGCAAPYRLLIYTRITNLSPLSSTIKSIYFNTDNYEQLFVPSFLSPATKYKMPPYMEKHAEKKGDVFGTGNPIKPILTIPAYGAIEGYIVFLGCPEIQEDVLSGELVIETTRKIFSEQIYAKRYKHEPEKYIDT